MGKSVIWAMRAGKEGQNEELVFSSGRIGIDYDFPVSLEPFGSREEVKAEYKRLHPTATAQQVAFCGGALWRLRGEMNDGEIVLLPMKTSAEVAVGQVSGSYEFLPGRPPGQIHTRGVKWLNTRIRRSEFSQSLLRQLNYYGTLFTVLVTDEDAALISEKPLQPLATMDEAAVEIGVSDLAADAYDAIRRHIDESYKLHALEELVEDVLVAQGFTTLRRESKGADGGVDVIAAHGPMGMGTPRICVQVKSGTTRIGRPEIQQLLGAVNQFHAELGLFVAWGGYRQGVLDAARENYHKIRLWDQDQLIEAILSNYQDMPQRSKDKLRLRQIWIHEPESTV